jgi:hypothetical protein
MQFLSLYTTYTSCVTCSVRKFPFFFSLIETVASNKWSCNIPLLILTSSFTAAMDGVDHSY